MLSMAVANLFLVMLIAPLRRWTLQTLESIVTVLLLLLLIGVVLGTPVGKHCILDSHSSCVVLRLHMPGLKQQNFQPPGHPGVPRCTSTPHTTDNAIAAGILYLSYKGLAFVVTSILTNFPQLQQLATNLVEAATTAVGKGKHA
jgi:hypothetical protein